MMLAESNPYSTLWNKYRPVILQLMSAAVENGPQQYKLFAHEFKAVGQKEKSGFSFMLEASNGKAVNNIKTSTVAKNLLQVLQRERKKRVEAFEAFDQTGREEQADKEDFELEVLEEFMPEPLSEDELEEIVDDVIAEVLPADKDAAVMTRRATSVSWSSPSRVGGTLSSSPAFRPTLEKYSSSRSSGGSWRSGRRAKCTGRPASRQNGGTTPSRRRSRAASRRSSSAMSIAPWPRAAAAGSQGRRAAGR